jgi:hypothetical protein
MSYDWSGRNGRRFEFWTSGELARIVVLLTVAIIPLSMEPRKAPPAPAAEIHSSTSGRLLMVRTTPLDLSKIAAADLGDEPVR